MKLSPSIFAVILFGLCLPNVSHGQAPTYQKVDLSSTTSLMADEAIRSPSLKPFVPDPGKAFKRFWVGNWRTPEQAFEWHVDLAEQGDYDVAIVSQGVARVNVDAKDSRIEGSIPRQIWDRTPLGTLTLAKGKQSLRVTLRDTVPTEGKLRSLELTPTNNKVAIAKQVKALRADSSWFGDAKYGVMFQWGAWGFPKNGPAKPWPKMIDDFDVNAFAKMVDEEMGAGYVIWSLTWRDSKVSAPLESVEKLVPGHTSKRDLIGDLADALNKRGIKLMLYYHAGHEDVKWWSANWRSNDDTTLFVDNWCSLISEIGTRYGERLSGWFFDDGVIYPVSAFERLAKAAKSGHSGRLIAWNSWVLPSLTDYQDLQFGEGLEDGKIEFAKNHGIWASGPQTGLRSHNMIMVDGPDWGIWKADTKINTFLTPEKGVELVKQAIAQDRVLSLNLQMYEDGSVGPQSAEVLQAVRKAIRGK